MSIPTVEGHRADVGEPRHPHGWPTKNPVFIGMLYASGKKGKHICQGVWDSVTGMFLFYPSKGEEGQYRLKLPTEAKT